MSDLWLSSPLSVKMNFGGNNQMAMQQQQFQEAVQELSMKDMFKQYNGLVRWVLSVEISATTTRWSMSNCIWCVFFFCRSNAASTNAWQVFEANPWRTEKRSVWKNARPSSQRSHSGSQVVSRNCRSRWIRQVLILCPVVQVQSPLVMFETFPSFPFHPLGTLSPCDVFSFCSTLMNRRNRINLVNN